MHDDLLKALKCCTCIDPAKDNCESCPYEYLGNECQYLCREAADAIEDLLDTNGNLLGTVTNMLESIKRFEKLESNLKDCKNKLCLSCGRYTDRHKGACDGCRWKEVR